MSSVTSLARPSAATPLLTETMKYITVNPTWNVPPSIINNEYLPALARDPNALARVGLQIGRNADGSIRIYQPPARETRSAASALTSRTASWSMLAAAVAIIVA